MKWPSWNFDRKGRKESKSQQAMQMGWNIHIKERGGAGGHVDGDDGDE